MADTKISGLSALTTPASGDLLPIVDVSDTSMDAAGTDKKITQGDLLSGSVDSIDSKVLVSPTGTTQNGVVVKAPSSSWGDGTAYGTAQAFMLLRDDAGGTEPDGNVLMRVNGLDGAIGTAGNLHVAAGLRQHAGYGANSTVGPGGAVWIDPYVDTFGIWLQPDTSVTQTASYIVVKSPASASVLELTADGKLALGATATAKVTLPAATSQAGGVDFGTDVHLYRSGVGGLVVGDAGQNTTLVVTSGNSANVSSLAISRSLTSEVFLGVPAATNNFTTGTAAGDAVLRLIDSAKQLWLGVGTAANEIRVQDAKLGFFNTTPVSKPTVTGSRGGNAALASLLTQLASLGLITDSSS